MRVIDRAGGFCYRPTVSTAELQEIVADLARSTKELRASQSETDRQLKELGKQVGNIGNKFGSFTEGMASKSVGKILRDQFAMETVGYVKIAKQGRHEEYDLLGYSNGRVNKAIVVEIKSKLEINVLEQMERKMREVFDWLPEHRGKTFEGMVAYVHAERAYENELREKILAKGWHLVSMGEDTFEVEDPKGFVATQYRYQGA